MTPADFAAFAAAVGVLLTVILLAYFFDRDRGEF